MGLFSRRDEPVQRPRFTINDRPQPNPEEPGTLQRRARIFHECMRRIAADPLASPTEIERPVADGLGLEELVARITPLFKNEQSMVRWVALRGALTQLYICTVDANSRTMPFFPVVEKAMGVGHIGPPPDDPTIDVGPRWRAGVSEDQRQAAIGVFGAVAVRVRDYDRYSGLQMNELFHDRCWLGNAVALDVIAWVAVALLRLELVDLGALPEPDRLDQPGWYYDPLWGKAQRYWDGGDWTARVRVADGRSFIERSQPLG